jgi:hypothetical protein
LLWGTFKTLTPAKVVHASDAVGVIPVAVATEEDKADQFYKSIPLLAAYHKEVPVGKPVPSYLLSSVTHFFQ